MTEHISSEELMAWRDGEVTTDRAAAIAAHVSTCATCRTADDDRRELSARIATWRVDPVPPSVVAPERQAAPAHPIPMKPIAVLIGAAALVVAGVMYMRPGTPATPEVEPKLDTTVTFFVDWLCGSCAADWPTLVDAVSRFEPRGVKFVIRDWPWDSDCNPHGSTIGGHEASCEAAVAVRLARKAGRAEEMIQWLFANRRVLMEPGSGAELIKNRVRDVLAIHDFDAAFQAEIPGILADVDEGARRKVMGTPWWFVGDQSLSKAEGPRPTAEDLENAIENSRLPFVRR